MELQITGKNIELSQAIMDYVQQKIGKLDRHLPNITDAKVEISKGKAKSPQQRYVAQVTLNSNGTLLRGEERASHPHAAIDGVADVMDRQIDRYKGKLYDKGRGISLSKGELPSAEAEQTAKIVKVKKFEVKPMSPEEAADQMELLGHDFFIFFNATTEETNVLYRRRDGDYGLIEPTPA